MNCTSVSTERDWWVKLLASAEHRQANRVGRLAGRRGGVGWGDTIDRARAGRVGPTCSAEEKSPKKVASHYHLGRLFLHDCVIRLPTPTSTTKYLQRTNDQLCNAFRRKKEGTAYWKWHRLCLCPFFFYFIMIIFLIFSVRCFKKRYKNKIKDVALLPFTFLMHSD